MKIVSQTNGSALNISLSGPLDMASAAALEKDLQLDGVEHLTLDLNECAYISSAGLRVLMGAQKRMAGGNRTMVLTHVSKEVYAVFDLTGLSKMLTIKQKVREIPWTVWSFSRPACAGNATGWTPSAS